VREKARAFAARGYVALAVDLYRGPAASDPDTAHQLMRGLPEDRAARDLEAAFAYLASRPDVDARRIGAVGWCMGGGYSLALALEEPRLAAAVVYYGRLATDARAIGRIKAKLLGNFGEEDKGIPPGSVRAFEAQARSAGVSADFKVYAGAGHGFASSRDPAVFRPEAARDADARTDAFLAKALSL
jgi:carboxymethylenebutenolidase